MSRRHFLPPFSKTHGGLNTRGKQKNNIRFEGSKKVSLSFIKGGESFKGTFLIESSSIDGRLFCILPTFLTLNFCCGAFSTLLESWINKWKRFPLLFLSSPPDIKVEEGLLLSSFLLADSFLKRDKRITLNYGDILRFSFAAAKLVFSSIKNNNQIRKRLVSLGQKRLMKKTRLRIKTMGNDNDSCFLPTRYLVRPTVCAPHTVAEHSKIIF